MHDFCFEKLIHKLDLEEIWMCIYNLINYPPWNLKFLSIANFYICFLEFSKISYPMKKKKKKGSHVCCSAKWKQWIRENVSVQYMDKFADNAKDALLPDNIFCTSNLNLRYYFQK